MSAAPIAVFGLGGSGTRAVAEILRAAGVYLGSELNAAGDSVTVGRFLRSQAAAYVEESGWITRLGQDTDAELPEPPPELVAECRATLDRQREDAPAPGSPWGWKNPRSIYALPVLHSAAPELRTVQLVRDGRDMAYSSNQNQLDVYGELVLPDRAGDPQPVRSIVLWSRVNQAALAYARRRLGGAYLVLRYEDLCADPAAAATRLVAHLEIPEPPGLAAAAARIVVPSEAMGRWRSAPLDETERLEAAAGAALRAFGYAS